MKRLLKEGMLFDTSNLQTASTVMTSFPDKTPLGTREEMIKAALTCPAGLKIGLFVKVDPPMAADASRHEIRLGTKPNRRTSNDG